MAVSGNATWTLRRDNLITRALNLAGLLNAGHSPTAVQIALGADFLQMVLQGLRARGVVVNAIERYTQALTAGQAAYTAPADTLDIEDGAVLVNTSGSHTPLELISQVYYNRLGVVSTTGQPTQYMVEKAANEVVSFTLYPIPTSDWPSVIYPRVRKPRDIDSGDVDIDLPPKFTLGVAMALASLLCRHYNRESKAKELLEESQDELNVALGDETPRGPMSFVAPAVFWRP